MFVVFLVSVFCFPVSLFFFLKLKLQVEVVDETLQEARLVFLVVAEGTKEREERDPTLASDSGTGGDVLARLLLNVHLDPLASVGVDGAGDELVLAEVTQAEPLTRLEDDAR